MGSLASLGPVAEGDGFYMATGLEGWGGARTTWLEGTGLAACRAFPGRA